MDTTGLRITAVAASMLEGFSPSSWTSLPTAETERVLLTDGDRTLIGVVWPPESEAAASAERIASSVLAPLLPADAFRLPTVLASRTVDGELLGREGEVTVMLTEPMPGLPLSTDMFEAHPALVDSLARAVALIHGADPGPVADAGLVVEESAELRERMLADLDSAAETGRVPASLLQRWEQSLEDVSAWRFLPVPVHANLGADALWVQDETIAGISELSRLRVGDPAADIAAVSSLLTPEDFERFFRAYRRHRGVEDPGLRARVGFHSEITVLDWLLAAVAAQDEAAIDDAAELLAALAEITDREPESRDSAPCATGAAASAEDGPADEDAAESGGAGGAAGERAATGSDETGPDESGHGGDGPSAGRAAEGDPSPEDPAEDDRVPNDPVQEDSGQAAATAEDSDSAAEAAIHGTRLIAGDAASFRPSAAPAYDEDGIGTEQIDPREG